MVSPPYPWEKSVSNKGRLRPTGVDTGSRYPWEGGTTSAPSEPPGALRALQFATSGETFLKDISGGRLDITRLPGYLEKPIDILVNPVGIGAAIAAPFTGGTSLSALGATGVGARVGGTLATQLAAGLVGGQAAQLAGEYAPGPEPVKLAAGLAAGLVGGVAGAKVTASRLPKAFAAAKGSGIKAPRERVITPRMDPVYIETPSSDITLAQKVSNAAKTFVDKGVIARAEVTPILDTAAMVDKEAVYQGNMLFARVVNFIGRHKQVIQYQDGATRLQLTDGKWQPIADVAADLATFETMGLVARPVAQTIRELAQELEFFRRQYASVGTRIANRGDIKPGGVYLPRGFEDIYHNPVIPRDKALIRLPSAARHAKHPSQEEGVTAGIKYPPLEENVRDYAENITKAIGGRTAAKQLMALKDPKGAFVFEVPENLIPPHINRAMLNSQNQLHAITQQLKKMQDQMAIDGAELTGLKLGDTAVVPAARQRIAELQQRAATNQARITQLQQDLLTSEQAHIPTKQAFDDAIAGVIADPTLAELDVKNLSTSFVAQGRQVYGPRGLVETINSQLNPNGTFARGAQVARTFSGPIRLMHTLFDLSDYGRLFGTAGLIHPFDFFKGISTGFRTMFTRQALGEDMRQLDITLRAGRSPYGVKHFVKFGLPIGSVDLDPSILRQAREAPGLVGTLGRKAVAISNITQSGITSFRLHMVATEVLNRVAAGEQLTDDIMINIIKGVKLTTGASIHRTPKNADVFLQFPNWIQSQVEYLVHSMQGLASRVGIGQRTLENDYASKSFMRLIALGLAVTYGVNALGGHKTRIKNGVPMMRIGNMEIDPFGPYGSVVRGAYAAIKGDATALVRSRTSPHFMFGWDLATGSTYNGDKTNLLDPEYWAQSLAPYSFTGTNVKQGPEITILQGAGVRAHEIPPFKLLREQAEQMMGVPWEDMSGMQREQLRAANPELMQAIQEQTVKRAKQGDKYAQYTLGAQEITDRILSQQETLNALWQEGQISSVQLRDALNNLALVGGAEKQQIAKTIGLEFGSRSPQPVRNALNSYFDLFNKADRGIMSGGPKVGVVNWDEFSRLEAELLSTLDAIQKKAITDRFTPHHPDLDWYFYNKEVIGESGYFEAVQGIVDRMLPQIQAIAPSARTYTDVQEAYNEAQRSGDTGAFLRLTALLSRINSQVEPIHRRLTLQDPELYKALVENGYIKQAKSRPLAANIGQ